MSKDEIMRLAKQAIQDYANCGKGATFDHSFAALSAAVERVCRERDEALDFGRAAAQQSTNNARRAERVEQALAELRLHLTGDMAALDAMVKRAERAEAMLRDTRDMLGACAISTRR